MSETPTAAPTGTNPSLPNSASPPDNSPGTQALASPGLEKGAAPKVSPPTPPEMFEVTVNGKMVKMTRDEVMGHASMSQAAHEKFEEAARLRKQNEKFDETLKKNKIQALIDKGFTKEQIRDEFEQWYKQEFIDPETLTPEQKKAREIEIELKKYKDDDSERKKKADEDSQTQLTNHQKEYLQTQIIEAMDQSGLPKTPFFAQRMAFYMRQNLVQGWEAPISMVVAQVKKEYQAITANVTENSTVEQLTEMFGEGVINKIRKHDLEQLRAGRETKASPTGANPLSPQSDEPISMSEVNRRLRDMRAGKV